MRIVSNALSSEEYQVMNHARCNYYASADVFVFPSYTETFGQVVLEAMASGLPVVGLYAEGICDLVSEGQSGLLVQMQGLSEQGQIQAYQQCLQRLVEERQTRQRMREAAVVAASKYNWYEAIEHMVRGYQEVLSRTQTLIAA